MIQRFISVQGLALCLIEWGDSSNPAVLILHGWLDQAASWTKVAERLVERGYYVIALEHRGHGISGHVSDYCDYHFPDYVADLQEVVQQLELEDFILIGHSMGGTISCLYTALCPVKPKKLILVDGVGTRHEDEEKAAIRYETHLKQRRKKSVHRVMTSREIAQQKLSSNHPYISEEWASELVLRITKTKEDGWIWTWDPRHRNRSAVGFHLPRFLRLLNQITVSTCLIFGGESWYVHLPDLPERIKAFPVSPKQIILPTGHSPHLENSSMLAEAISSFLEDK